MQRRQHVRGAGSQQGVILTAQQRLFHRVQPVRFGVAAHFRVKLAARQHQRRAEAAAVLAPAAIQQTRQIPGQTIGNIHQHRRAGIAARARQHQTGVHLRQRVQVSGAGRGPALDGRAAVLFQNGKSHTGKADLSHKKDAVAGHGPAAGQKNGLVRRAVGFAPDSDGNMQAVGAGQIAAGQRHTPGTRRIGHAREKGVQPGDIHVVGKTQRQSKGLRTRAAGGQIADIHRQRLVADIFRRKIGTPKMHILQKQIIADAQRAAGAQHGAVVAAADEQCFGSIGKMQRQPFQDVVLGTGRTEGFRHSYSSGSRYSSSMTFRPKPGKFTWTLSGGRRRTILPLPKILWRQ